MYLINGKTQARAVVSGFGGLRCDPTRLAARGVPSLNCAPPLLCWIVIQPGTEPFLRLGNGEALAPGVFFNLVLAEFANGEVFRLRVRKIKPAHRAARPHRVTFRQRDARVSFHVEQFPENSLFRVVRARRITRRRPDAAIFFLRSSLRSSAFPDLPKPHSSRTRLCRNSANASASRSAIASAMMAL